MLCTAGFRRDPQGLTIGTSSIQLSHSTPSVHQGHVASGHSSASAGSRDASILGRHIPCAGITASGLSDTRCQLTTALLTRIYHKSAEVGSRAPSGVAPSRRHDRRRLTRRRLIYIYPPQVRLDALVKASQELLQSTAVSA